MKSSKRLVLLTAASVMTAMVSSHDAIQACGEATGIGGASYLRMDGFIPLADIDSSMDLPLLPANPSEVPAGHSCPVPPCSATTCATVNPSTPFVRVPGTESAPIFHRAGCFGIAKKNDNFYVQLTMDGGGGAMTRNVSTDGGFTWTETGIVLDPDNHWFNGMKCPDPHFIGDQGKMVVYFKAFANPGGIARAVSNDDGVTWTVDSAPLVTSGTPGYFLDNPSVIQRNPTLWLMAYTYACAGPGITGPFQMAETHLAYSSDGLNWTKSPFNPAITVGDCGAWDQGGIANPVLMNDPNNGSKVHLFYTGANWNGQTTRGCAKFGHAISTNGGRNFCKTGVVIDHPSATSPAWDDEQYMVSSFTIEPNNKIRAYYWAQGQNAFGLGVAEADWPLPGCPSPQHVDHAGVGMADQQIGDFSELLDGTVPFLRTQPNPSNGRTFIHHNLDKGQFDGIGSVTVFDIQGREIARVWSGRLDEAPTQFEWDGLDRSGQSVAAGRYLIRLNRGGEALATSWVTVMP